MAAQAAQALVEALANRDQESTNRIAGAPIDVDTARDAAFAETSPDTVEIVDVSRYETLDGPKDGILTVADPGEELQFWTVRVEVRVDGAESSSFIEVWGFTTPAGDAYADSAYGSGGW